jgi:hypothetical protein
MFERRIVKIYTSVKEGENWRIGTNKEIRNMLQGGNILKFIKPLRLRWYCHAERMQS